MEHYLTKVAERVQTQQAGKTITWVCLASHNGFGAYTAPVTLQGYLDTMRPSTNPYKTWEWFFWFKKTFAR